MEVLGKHRLVFHILGFHMRECHNWVFHIPEYHMRGCDIQGFRKKGFRKKESHMKERDNFQELGRHTQVSDMYNRFRKVYHS